MTVRRAHRRSTLALALLAGCGLFGEDEDARNAVPAVRVEALSPQGAVRVTQPVRVRFSEALAREDLVGRSLDADEVLVVSPPLEGRGRWTDRRTFELVPGVAFADNTRYTVRVRERVVGRGRRLDGARRFTFHTPLFRVVSVQGTRVEGERRAVLELSHPTRTDDAAGAVTFRNADGRVLPVRLLGEGLQTILRFRMPPERAESPEEIRVRVEPTLTPEAGGEALDKPVIAPVTFEPPSEPTMRLLEVVPAPSGDGFAVRAHFDVLVDAERAAPYVTVTPATPVRVVREHLGFRIEGDFAPGVTHRILLKEGLPTMAGQLAADWEGSVVVPGRLSRLAFADGGPFLRARGGRLALDANAVSRVRVRSMRIPDRFVGLVDVQDPFAVERLGEQASDVERDVVPGPQGRFTLDVSDLVRGPGLHWIEVEDAQRGWVRAAGWLLQRGLLARASVGPEVTRVEVLADPGGRAVPGARVSAYGRTGRRVFQGVTDGSGAARFGGSNARDDEIAWIVARRGGDAAYLPMVASRLTPTPPPEAPEGFVWLARDYALPGEALEAFGLATSASGGGVFELSGDGGDTVEAPGRREGRLVQASLRVPADAAPGLYSVRWRDEAGEVNLGHAPVHVGSTRPEPLEVTVSPATPADPSGPMRFGVRTRSRFGGRTEGFVVRARCWYRAIPVAPSGYAGFTFGRDRPVEASPPVSLPAARLDARGAATVACPRPLEVPLGHDLEVRVEVSVTEPGGRPVVRTAQARLPTLDPHVGLRPTGDGILAVAVDGDGRAVPGVPLRAAVWRAPRPGAPLGAPLARVTMTSAASPARVPFDPPTAGRYHIRVETGAGGPAAARAFGVVTGTVTAPLSTLFVDAPSRPLKVGETARVEVRAAFAGRGRLTVERDGVLLRQPIRVRGSGARVEIPVLASFAPRARVAVMLEGGDGARAYGEAVVTVAADEARRKVAIELLPGQGGDRIPVRVTAEGAGSDARVLLTVVPAGRLAAGAGERRDPASFFLAPRPFRLVTHDPLGLEAPAPVARAAGPRGGYLEPPEGRLQPSEVFVAGPKALSARGVAYLSARLPEGAGRGVLTAVVYDEASYGQAQVPLSRAAGPIVRLEAPRALVPGDRVQVPLTIENPGDRDWVATASTSAQGGLRLSGAGRVQAKVAAGQRRTLGLTLEAIRPGAAELSADVEADRATARVLARIDVAPLTAPTVTGGGVAVTNRNPGRLEPAVAGTSAQARLTIGPGWAARFPAAVDTLAAGPASFDAEVALGLVALSAPALLQREGGGRGDDPVRDARGAALEAVETRLDDRDRLRAWPGGPSAPAGLGLQAGLLVGEAHRIGLASRAQWGRVQVDLERMLSSPDQPAAVRARAAFALALGGQRGFEVPEALLGAEAPEVRAPLAAGLILSGRRSQAAPLFEAPLNAPEAAEDIAWTLLALATVAPRHASVAPLSEALVAAAERGRWATPAANGLGVFALARRDRGVGAGRPYWGSVLVNGEVVKRFNSKRPFVLEAPAAAWKGGIDLQVTGAGEAQVGLSVVATGGEQTPRGMTVTRTHRAPGASAALSDSLELGRLSVVDVTVSAASPGGLAVVRVPIAAGFTLERVWPGEGIGEPLRPRGHLRREGGGLVWTVPLEGEPTTLRYTVRAVRAGRFVEPPAEAWRADRPAVYGRTDRPTWTVAAP